MGDGEQPSPQRPRRIEKEFEDVTREEAAWAQLSNNIAPQQQQQQAIVQVISSTTAVGQPGFVQQEKQKYEQKTVAQLEEEQ